MRNPLIEPLWEGTRVLAQVTPVEATLTDIEGDAVDLEGDAIQAALAAATLAESLVVDGYLTRQATQPAQGVVAPEIPVISQSEMAGQFLLGSSARRARLTDDAPTLADPDAPLALVAVDLLLLDGSPLFDVPLLERKRLLESALEEGPFVRRSIFVRPPIDTWIPSWRALGFTRMAYKDVNSRYEPGTTNDAWAIAPIPRR